MSRLNTREKNKLARTLRKQVPDTWAIIAPRGQEYIEIDQDGERPSHQFPAVGSVVLRVQDSPEGVQVSLFKRVRCVPGYSETRKSTGVLVTDDTDTWQDIVTRTVIDTAQELGVHVLPSR